MKVFRGVFVKLSCAGYFLNYFSKEKAWTESMGPVNGSIEFIKRWSSITGSVVQIKSAKGYALVLISCIGSQMNGHELIRWGGGALAAVGAGSQWGTMAAHPRWVAWRLRCFILYGVSSYGFGTTWGTHFTNLWAMEMSYTEWAAAFFTLTWPMSRSSSSHPSVSRMGREACRRPPLAPMPVQ
jgi:hypothetical protein